MQLLALALSSALLLLRERETAKTRCTKYGSHGLELPVGNELDDVPLCSFTASSQPEGGTDMIVSTQLKIRMKMSLQSRLKVSSPIKRVLSARVSSFGHRGSSNGRASIEVVQFKPQFRPEVTSDLSYCKVSCAQMASERKRVNKVLHSEREKKSDRTNEQRLYIRRHSNKQTNKQTDRQTDKQTNKHNI